MSVLPRYQDISKFFLKSYTLWGLRTLRDFFVMPFVTFFCRNLGSPSLQRRKLNLVASLSRFSTRRLKKTFATLLEMLSLVRKEKHRIANPPVWHMIVLSAVASRSRMIRVALERFSRSESKNRLFSYLPEGPLKFHH